MLAELKLIQRVLTTSPQTDDKDAPDEVKPELSETIVPDSGETESQSEIPQQK